MLGNKICRRYFEILSFFIFFLDNRIDMSYLLSHKETMCTKCQILFSVKNMKNFLSLSSAYFDHSTVSVNSVWPDSKRLCKMQNKYCHFPPSYYIHTRKQISRSILKKKKKKKKKKKHAIFIMCKYHHRNIPI